MILRSAPPSGHRSRLLAIAGCCLLAAVFSSPAFAANDARLPEGRNGLAARHPGDRGIENSEHAIFAEDFEEPSTAAAFERWESIKNGEKMSLDADTPDRSTGDRSLRMRHVGGQGTGCHLYRRLQPGRDRVFARFYVKFSEDCAPVHHFGTHLGGFNPPTPWPQGGAGERPRGDRRWTTGVEPYGGDWRWDFYTYWQGMHLHGDGNYWGTPFLSGVERPPVECGEWICVEMMVKMNQPPSASNGEQAFWIDGNLVRAGEQVVSHIGPGFPRGRWRGGWWSPDADADNAFGGFRWRTVQELAINYVWTYLYITDAEPGHVSRVWFDDIVVADRYIGPLSPPEGADTDE